MTYLCQNSQFSLLPLEKLVDLYKVPCVDSVNTARCTLSLGSLLHGHIIFLLRLRAQPDVLQRLLFVLIERNFKGAVLGLEFFVEGQYDLALQLKNTSDMQTTYIYLTYMKA